MGDHVLILNKTNYGQHHHQASGRVVLVDNSNTSNQIQQNGGTTTNQQNVGPFRFVRMANVSVTDTTVPAVIQPHHVQLQLKMAEPITTLGISFKYM